MKVSLKTGAACLGALMLLATARLAAQDGQIAGSDRGLYRPGNGSGAALPLWEKAGVRKIMRAGDRWFFLTGAGVVTSQNLSDFEERNTGLPVKVIKSYADGKKAFIREVQELKDLEIHPANPSILVTATKDAVYLTRDAGLSWTSLGLGSTTAGAKAVAVMDLPDSAGAPRLTVFLSHPIYGIYWKQPDVKGATWRELDAGLEKVPSIQWPDEVADLATAVRNGEQLLYASQTFMPRIYRLDWAAKRFVQLWSGPDAFDTVESLVPARETFAFVGPDGIFEVPGDSGDSGKQAATQQTAVQQAAKDQTAAFRARKTPILQISPRSWKIPGNLLCAWIPANATGGRGSLSLSELWLLSPSSRSGAYTAIANLKKGNYLPVHQVTTDAGLDAHLATLEKNRLNMLVVDMKDDIGTIRYNSKDPLVLRKGKFGRGIDLETFVQKAKARNLYLVARIVVFKDKALASWDGSKYAVWDRTEGKPWQGYELVTRKLPASTDPAAAKTETVRKYIQEYWVDPYSEEVWEYNIAISKELIARGFDEIQFDYIRFPTDGKNLENASYRWKDTGMDKESALMSFLSYARREIKAPISIDIYGANGWYRTGARTGQDVELLSRYVDVICPMFYPSHFEQSFLAQPPAEERPYRIYYFGSYRNAVIARNHVVVRPWAQAFYLNVSYDRAWYNPDYVQRQIFGTRDSINQGYTYWNNSGRYADLRPDIDPLTPYPWKLPDNRSESVLNGFPKRETNE